MRRCGLLVLGILAMCYLGVLIWDMHREATLFSRLAKEEPAEANRIRHPRGFSVVEPMGWIHRVDDVGEEGPDAMIWVFASSGRFAHSYGVSRIRSNLELEALDEATFTALYAKDYWKLKPILVQFQGRNAVLRQFTKKGGGFENPTLTSGVIHLRRGEWCYQIRYHLVGEFSEVPPGLWRFFETLEAK